MNTHTTKQIATPRTASEIKWISGNWENRGDHQRPFVTADFARILERELADCRRTCAELVTDGNHLVAENAKLRDVLRTYNITVPETKPKRGPQPCSHCGGNGWEP